MPVTIPIAVIDKSIQTVLNSKEMHERDLSSLKVDDLLKTFWFEFPDHKVRDWDMNGKKFDKEVSLETVMLYSKSVGLPTWVFLLEPNENPAKSAMVGAGWQLFVKNLDGKTITVKCLESDTVGELKMKIRDRCGIPEEVQRLQFEGKILEDEKTLTDYNIEKENTIQLLGNLRGGLSTISDDAKFSFVDVTSKNGPIEVSFSKKAPRWRAVSRGLSIQGHCTNKRCAACNKMVITCHGFRVFDITLDGYTNLCPICFKFVEPETTGFLNCDYRFWGLKIVAADQPPQHFISPWKTAPNGLYTLFAEQRNGTAKFARLVIEAKQTLTGEDMDDSTCLICFGNMWNFTETSCCERKFHHRCLENWKSYANYCPYCRAVDDVKGSSASSSWWEKQEK